MNEVKDYPAISLLVIARMNFNQVNWQSTSCAIARSQDNQMIGKSFRHLFCHEIEEALLVVETPEEISPFFGIGVPSSTFARNIALLRISRVDVFKLSDL